MGIPYLQYGKTLHQMFFDVKVEYIEKKGYNITNDISKYAGEAYYLMEETGFTNELVAESYALYLADKNNGLANYIIKLLEQEGW